MRPYAFDLEEALQRARAELAAQGLLLEADAALPSLAGLLAGGPVSGSWWAHPLAHEIYMVGGRLRDDPDALVAKLVNGKLTYIHRALWPPVVALAACGDPWQIDGLSPHALTLLQAVEAAGVLTPAPASDLAGRKARRDSLAQLERRLLVVSSEEHTDSGRHAKQLESWAHWAARVGFPLTGRDAAQAKRELERVAGALGPTARLPWMAGA